MQIVHRRKKSNAKLFKGLATGVVAVAAIASGVGWYLHARSVKRAPDTLMTAANTPTVLPKSSVDSRNGASPKSKTDAAAKPTANDFRLVSDERAAAPAPLASRPASQPAASQPAKPMPSPASQPIRTASAPSGGVLASRPSVEPRPVGGPAEEGKRLAAAGKSLEARDQLNRALKAKLTDSEESEVRSQLARLADETIFGRNTVAGDPLFESYAVQTGDRLVNIAPKYNVPYEAIMVVNGIADAAKIREGQKLKMPRGPFHVKISKAKFRLDVYLGDVYVRSYRVGLGAESGTPEGVWKVKNRLTNPTYYPPASSSTKRIIAPDDPNNPLGEHWIGLEGIEGEAVGHEGFGIHGTIEPDSIGKAVSLGCVRMHNEDVAFLYKLLMPGKSLVTVVP